MKHEKLLKDRYEILQKIGSGGMGEVFLCYDTLLQMYRAGKCIHKSQGKEAKSAYEALKQETKILAGLRHPGIPAVVDCMEDADRYIVIMEYMEGVSLRERVKQKMPEQAEILCWCKHILELLRYLHQEVQPPIIYRDLKPDNLLLSAKGDIMLIDFGIALQLKGTCMDSEPCWGTPGYASPEQSQPGQIDCRSDLYSFGALMFYLITGTVYNGQSLPVSWMKEIMRKCLQKDPDMRYQSADEILYDMGKLQPHHKRAYPVRFLLAGTFCILLYVIAAINVQKLEQLEYEKLLHLKDYIQAIRSYPQRQEAYVYYYDELKRQKEHAEEAIPYAIGIMEQLPLDELNEKDREELYFAFASDCFSLHKPIYYRKASDYLRQIHLEDFTAFRKLSDLLGIHEEIRAEQLGELQKLLQEVETYAEASPFPQQKRQLYQVLVQVYAAHDEHFGSYAYEKALQYNKKVMELLELLVPGSHDLNSCREERLELSYRYGTFLELHGQQKQARNVYLEVRNTFHDYYEKGFSPSNELLNRLQRIEDALQR